MGSNLNFKNFGNGPPAGGGCGGRPPGSFPLARQASIYSLTFDEFQSTVGEMGKDFGSMNMDELLKNIWSAEESQNFGSNSGAGGQGVSDYLQRQGSLTLPRTLSQKTVDEVWREMPKKSGEEKDASGRSGGFCMPQRQQTLGEITIEEFLMRAGVVTEGSQLAAKTNNFGVFGDLSRPVNCSGLGFGYQLQASRNAGSMMGGGVPESGNQIGVQSAGDLLFNVNGVRSATQLLDNHQLQKLEQQQQQQQILPNQPALSYGSLMGIPSSSRLGGPQNIGGKVGISDPTMSNTLVTNAALQGGGLGMVCLGTNGVTVATGSPALSSDELTKRTGDTSLVTPVPFVFNNGGLRGRRSAALEKVVERRQRRMIKNRESAARSRARKQAYAMELEKEVAKLKAEHEELQKKQAEMMQIQKNQVLQMMKQQDRTKRQCLRRTQTSPW